jgi:hypothetical protein
VKKQLT